MSERRLIKPADTRYPQDWGTFLFKIDTGPGSGGRGHWVAQMAVRVALSPEEYCAPELGTLTCQDNHTQP